MHERPARFFGDFCCADREQKPPRERRPAGSGLQIYVLAAAVTARVGQHLVGTREEHRRRRLRLDGEVVEHRSQESDTSSQTVAVPQLEVRSDREAVGAFGVRRRGLASLDALQRAVEPADREQLLPEAKARVDELGPDVFDVRIESSDRGEILDGLATPERDGLLERIEGIGSGRSGQLAAAHDEASELPEIDVDTGRVGEGDQLAIGAQACPVRRPRPLGLDQVSHTAERGAQVLSRPFEVGVGPDDLDELVPAQRAAHGDQLEDRRTLPRRSSGRSMTRPPIASRSGPSTSTWSAGPDSVGSSASRSVASRASPRSAFVPSHASSDRVAPNEHSVSALRSA